MITWSIPADHLQIISEKVWASHDSGVQARGIAEHVHGYQLVEKLLPVCEDHGLILELFDGEGEYTTITSPMEMAKHMSACDVEWLLVSDCNVERTEDDDPTYITICLVYGNCADDVEIGRGEMVVDWGGLTDWFEIFDPVIDDFVNDYYIQKKAKEEVTV